MKKEDYAKIKYNIIIAPPHNNEFKKLSDIFVANLSINKNTTLEAKAIAQISSIPTLGRGTMKNPKKTHPIVANAPAR